MFDRKFEECSTNLADRIIAASYLVEQKQSVFNRISSMFRDFALPNPAYIMPAMFFFGLLISVSLTSQLDINDFVDNMYLTI